MLFPLLVEDLWVLGEEEKEKKASSRGSVSGWALLPYPYPSRARAPPRRRDWTAAAADASMSAWTWASRPCPRQEGRMGRLEEVRGVCLCERGRVCGRERGRVETWTWMGM